MLKFTRLAVTVAVTWLSAAAIVCAQDQLASWRTPPSPQAEDYPSFALDFGFSGSATLECDYDPTGWIESCKAVSEAPEGLGFGAAAVSIGQRGVLNPAFENGVPQGGRFTFRIPFSLKNDEPAFKPLQGPEPDPAALALAERVIDQLGFTSAEYHLRSAYSLPADRREIVVELIKEAFPDEQELRQLAIQGAARVFPASALKAMIEGRQPSDDDLKQINRLGPQVFGRLFDVEAAQAEVRAGYCARYDCGGVAQ